VKPLSHDAKAFLLALARQTISCSVSAQVLRLPEANDRLPDEVRRCGAAFVTLTLAGQLRGCVGQVTAQRPLIESVIDAARGAACRDTRFQPITAEEAPLVQIHLSLLSEPRALHCSRPEDLLDTLRPGLDGVILTLGARMATFLPQVWAHIPSPEEFLDQLSLKAGLNRKAWKAPEAIISVYETENVEEPVP